MKEIILNQKNINKLDFKLSFKQLQEKMKIQKDLKTIEKGKKLVVKGRIIYKYPNIKHNKKIKKIIIKEDNEVGGEGIFDSRKTGKIVINKEVKISNNTVSSGEVFKMEKELWINSKVEVRNN